MILYKLLPLKINEASHVMCPLVHNYSVITLDNWLTVVLHGPKITKQDHKTVDCECLFIQQFASIAWLHSHFLFSYFRFIFVQSFI